MTNAGRGEDLCRFVRAQVEIYPRALAELQAGAKRSHWMWFVFPQIAGLGRSPMARYYAIRDRHEARAYLGHELLGSRLRECAVAVMAHAGARTAEAILGGIDAVKLRSAMTLFETAGGEEIFGAVIDAFYGGSRDPETLRLLDAVAR